MFAQLHIFLSQAAVIWHLYLPARSTSTDSSTVCPVQTCARTTKCIDDCQGKHEKRCKCTCVLRNTHISTRCTMIPHGFVATSSCSCTYRCTRTQAHAHKHTHTHIHTHTHTHTHTPKKYNISKTYNPTPRRRHGFQTAPSPLPERHQSYMRI